MGGGCLSRTLGASLLLCNVINRAKSDVQVAYVDDQELVSRGEWYLSCLEVTARRTFQAA